MLKTVHVKRSLCALSLVVVGGCTALSGLPSKVPGAGDVTGATTNAQASISAVKDSIAALSQLSALTQLSALGNSGSASNSLGSGASSSSAYRIAASCTPGTSSVNVSGYNFVGHNGDGTTWTFTPDVNQSYYTNTCDGTSAGTFVGSERVTDAGGAVVESGTMKLDWTRAAGGSNTNWAGTDDMDEQIAASSLRPTGHYRHTRDTIRTSSSGPFNTTGSLDNATESVTYYPTTGSGLANTVVRREYRSSDSSVDVYQDVRNGSLPNGTTYTMTNAGTQSTGVMAMNLTASIGVDQGRHVDVALNVNGVPSASGHGAPQSLDSTSGMILSLRSSDDSLLAQLNLNQLSINSSTGNVTTNGLVMDAQGKQAGTFAGGMNLGNETWTGVATFTDGSTSSIVLTPLVKVLFQ